MPTNWDTIFTTLWWTETFYMAGRQTHISIEVSESLQFNVLIRDARVKPFAHIETKAALSPQLF